MASSCDAQLGMLMKVGSSLVEMVACSRCSSLTVQVERQDQQQQAV